MGGYKINEDGSVTRRSTVRPSAPIKNNGGNGRIFLWAILTVIAVIAVWFVGKNIYDENSYITTDPSGLDCGYKGGSYTVYIKSNRGWDITTYTDNWCKLSKDNRADAVRLNISQNNSIEPRQDYFVLNANGKTCRVDVRQKGKPYLRVSSTLVNVGGDGGEFNISVACSEDWKISGYPYSWVHLSKNSNGISIVVEANRSDFSRSTTFVVESPSNKETIKIEQNQTTAFLNISDIHPRFQKESSYQTLTIDANPDWYIVTYPSNWVSLYRSGNMLRVSVGYHSGVKKRATYFTVTSGTRKRRINITQYGSDGWEEIFDMLN